VATDGGRSAKVSATCSNRLSTPQRRARVKSVRCLPLYLQITAFIAGVDEGV